MSAFLAALWAEALKARRSKISLLTAVGFMLLPLAGGLFMVILKNPEQARAMGLISAKAQLTVGVADWPALMNVLAQGIAAAGAILFALITAWVFGREFSDHTAKELLALPTPRWVIVAAKFVLTALWNLALTLLVFGVGLGVGAAVNIPGWSSALVWTSFWTVLVTALLTFMLLPFAALFASLGRGYLSPMGWTILALALANVVSVLGWGDWFPWAVPILVSGMVKAHAEQVGLHSYLVVLLAFFVGSALTFAWWQRADQTR
ncbi:MAG: ABC transporter permease [Anaerolineae bacterium]